MNRKGFRCNKICGLRGHASTGTCTWTHNRIPICTESAAKHPTNSLRSFTSTERGLVSALVCLLVGQLEDWSSNFDETYRSGWTFDWQQLLDLVVIRIVMRIHT